ncbi:hypothetical protein [Roseomonas sp. 18066]|uniref:hypothetical protein n=1 Tax=Roseomonas sp. 18066 TaxID=2681412 RepID=UPI001356E8DA|nr:hypothetical protein [Roseomonas sp. 18066]
MAKKPRQPSLPIDPVNGFLCSLPHTGEAGFEGLVARVLTAETGRTFRLQRSGNQAGRDAETELGTGTVISMEAKHYSKSMPDLRDLTGGLAQASLLHPPVDVWVVATTAPLSPEMQREIGEHARGHGIDWFALDADPEGPRLLWLLAAQEKAVLAFAEQHHPTVDRAALASALQALTQSEGFGDRLARLRHALHSKILGFADAAGKVHAAVRGALSSPSEMGRRFNQDVAVLAAGREVVPRLDISRGLDRWLHDLAPAGTHAAVLGEEGAGKTWAVLAWIADLLEQPWTGWLVVPISASATRFGDGDTIEDILPLALARWTETDEEEWRPRLRRWLNDKGPTPPRLLVILDGLNERTELYWAAILSRLEEPAWAGRVAAVIVDRPLHWDEACARKMGTPFHRVPVAGYTPAELRLALRAQGVDAAKVPPDLDDLIRLPRYCGLVCRHFAEMAASGDFTRARVIYLDTRDRAASRRKYPLTNQEFEDLVVEAARLHRKSRDGVPKHDFAALVPGPDRSRDVVAELHSSGILVPVAGSTGRYRVEPVRLAYAIGLLLAEDLASRARSGAGEAEIDEAIAQWLEPEPDADLKVEAAAAALFRATLAMDSYPAIARRALLHHWLRLRNWNDNARIAVLAYVRRIPEDFVAAAERIWSSDGAYGGGEDFVARAFIEHRDDPAVQPILIAAVEYWLGFVQEVGFPFHRAQEGQAGLGPEPAEIRSRLDALAAEGSVAGKLGIKLHATGSDGLIRLRSLALGVMSAGSRLPFARAIPTWAVSSAVMDYTLEADKAAWILQLTDEDLDPVLLPAALALAQGDETEREAARMLLRALGTHGAGNIATLHPAPLNEDFERLRRQHAADPCRGFFQLTEPECETCLGRDDIPMRALLLKSESYLLDPNASVPSAFLDRVEVELALISADAFGSHRSHTSQDHDRERMEVVLAGRRPGPLAVFYRRVIASLPARCPEDAAGIGRSLPAFAPLLTRRDADILLAAVQRLDAEQLGKSEVGLVGGLFFGTLLLLTPEQRAQQLLRRAEAGFDFRDCEKWNGGLASEMRADILSMLHDPATSPQRLIRCLLLLGANAGPTMGLAQHILRLAHHGSKLVRGAALRAAYILKDAKLGRALADIVQPSATEHRRQWEEGYGSSLLARYGKHLPLDDLASRLHPAALSFALVWQDRDDADIRRAAAFLELGWARAADADASTTMTPPAVDSLPTEETAGMGRPVVQTGGADDDDSTASLGQGREAFLPDDRGRQWDAFLRRMAERERALEEAWGTDAFSWYATFFSADGLTRIVKQRPDLADRWAQAVIDDLDDALQIRLNGFNGPLAAAMFQSRHPLALEFWQALFRRSSSGDDIIRIAFDAPDGEEAGDAARDEVLAACRSDEALQRVALHTMWSDRQAWFDAAVDRCLGAGPLWRRAVGLYLLSFSDVELDRFDVFLAKADIAGTWVTGRVDDLRARVVANRRAKEWYRRFCVADDPVTSWGAFRMVLATADGRFAIWRTTAEAGLHGAWKLPYVASNETALSQAIKKRAGEEGKLFGTRTQRGHISPFVLGKTSAGGAAATSSQG